MSVLLHRDRALGAVLLLAAGCAAAQSQAPAHAPGSDAAAVERNPAHMPAAGAVAGEPGSAHMLGFDTAAAAEQARLERDFDANLSAEELRGWMQRLSAAPNHVGSEHDRQNAEFVRDALRSWGWRADIETFSVLYPTPKQVSLQMLSPTPFTARLAEPPVPGDTTSSQIREELPPYNVYGADGDVTAELVYVNYGMPEDYQELQRLGIGVAGRIVIARYGGGWRGLKPKLAHEHGAVGCIIYSDPEGDGYRSGDVYPRGGFRPPDGVQRGSVQDFTPYAGDPLTPGIAATANAPRLPLSQARSLLKIPVLPISYADAQPLLAALAGLVAPARWQGALPLTYHVGPGPAKVRLRIESDWNRVTLYDVIAKLAGRAYPQQWIVRGNHRDAWVFGASDPFSGHVAWLAEAKSIGLLAKRGWRPRRTLVYASWDGEEPGLLGSTEWVEAHATELKAKAALYVNTDMSMRGTLEAGGSQGLRSFVSEIAASVQDPETGVSLLQRAGAAARVKAFESRQPVPARDAPLPLEALGSGSDFTPFLQHLGVASLNLEFGGEEQYGVYHSAYDSFDHFRRFVDPSFQYGVATAKVVGRAVLRAAQAPLLPLRAQDFSEAVATYSQELKRLHEDLRARGQLQRQLIRDDAFRIAEDPSQPRAAPAPIPDVPALDFALLDKALERLATRAKAFDARYDRLLQPGDSQSRVRRERCNALLTQLETQLTEAHGLPEREWYTHMIYAPGAHTGYGVKTLPGVREAIEEYRWDEANHYLAVIAGVLDAWGMKLETAAGP